MRPNLIQVPVNLAALAVLLLAGMLAVAVMACGGEDPTQAPAATAPSGSQAQQPTTAAPSGQQAATPAPTTAAERISALEGDISIDGSSTVFPITEQWPRSLATPPAAM